MSKRIYATGAESAIVKSWKGWDGDGLEWMYFYDCQLLPNVLKACVDKGYSPDAQYNVELCVNALTAEVFTIDEGDNDVSVIKYKLSLTIAEE